MAMAKLLKNLQKYLIYIIVFFLPLVVTTLFPNAFFVGKLTLLSFGVALSLLVWAASFGLTGKAPWGTGKFDAPLLLLAGTYIVSSILRTPNKMEAFLLPGSATILIAGVLLYFLVNQLGKDGQKRLLDVIFYSAVVFSLISLFATTGILAKVPGLPEYVTRPDFNTLGGHLPAALFLFTVLPLSLGMLVKEKDTAKKLLRGVAIAIVALALMVAVNASLPGKPQTPTLTTFSTSWNVAVDTLQTRPVWGIGPGNYLTAFNRFKPLSYNQTDLWSVRFTSARNFYLTVITEAGLAATLALVILLMSVYRVLIEKLSSGIKKLSGTAAISLLVLLVLIAIFPAPPYIMALLFVLLALNSGAKTRILDLSAGDSSKLPALIISLPLVATLVVFGFYGTRALSAEAKFRQALESLAANDGRATYDTLREAIALNPYVDRYRGTYSQVNLALARNIAANPPEEGLSDTERQTVATLIQQAIREARTVVTLNQLRSGSWEILARTYQSIIAFAEGADGFATQSFNQAIALDPLNPNLRIALGGLLYALEDYDEAIAAFRLAIAAKPDLANAHYNLAVAYREKGDIDSAIIEMTNVLALVDRDSPDFDLAKEVLTGLEERRAAEGEDTENLTTPAEQEQLLEPPLELPEDSGPPEDAVPTQSPSPSPAP